MQYAADGFRLVLPSSREMFCKETLSQGNICLLDYIYDHTWGDTNILFLHKEEKPHKPFGTVEIKNGVIKQVRGRFNLLPDRSVFIFLEKYAMEKGLDYNPVELISETDEEYIENPDDLRVYVDDYKRRMSHPNMHGIGDGS